MQKPKTVRIGIDGGGFDPGAGAKNGIERLLSGFLLGLPDRVPGNRELYLYGFNMKKGPTSGQKVNMRVLPDRLFSSFFLPAALVADRIGIYFGISGVIPPFLRLFKKKSLVFIHDYAFLDHPENYGNAEKMRWQTEYALFGSDRVVVFSDYIKRQTYNRFPKLPENKVVRIYPGGDHLKGNTASQGRNGPFFLYVGVIKPAKNILVLLSRFEKFIRFHRQKNVKLLLVGTQEKAYLKTIKETVVYQKLKGNIEFRDGVKDKELAGLYRNCRALLNVSHDEGFCYPVIEALGLGKPAIVNEIPLYHEFKPFFKMLEITKSEDEFIAAMKKCMEHKPIHQVKDTPFRWNRFTNDLLLEADKLI